MKGRGVVAAILACALAVLLVFPAPVDALSEMTAEERGLALAVIAEQRWNGTYTGVVLDGDLVGQAQLQAQRMARCECLFHSPFGELHWYLGRGWHRIDENVAGPATSAYAAHLALVASPGHLAKMLNPGSRGFGVAIRRDGSDGLWVAQLYGSF